MGVEQKQRLIDANYRTWGEDSVVNVKGDHGVKKGLAKRVMKTKNCDRGTRVKENKVDNTK